MSTFLSYTRKDQEQGRQLAEDLRRMSRTVWLDDQIYGGTQWWQEIIDQIRAAEIFLLALSDHSMASQPCRDELRYAQALRLPIVPVQVGPVTNMRIPLAGLQIIDYRHRDADAAIELIAAVTRLTAQPRLLPDPLPEPPEIPFAYLYRLARQLEQEALSHGEQQDLIDRMQKKFGEETDPVALNDLRLLLQILHARQDVTVRSAAEIDRILSEPVRVGTASAERGATWLTADILDKHRPKPGSVASPSATFDWPTAVPARERGSTPAAADTGTGQHPGPAIAGRSESEAESQHALPEYLRTLVRERASNAPADAARTPGRPGPTTQPGPGVPDRGEASTRNPEPFAWSGTGNSVPNSGSAGSGSTEPVRATEGPTGRRAIDNPAPVPPGGAPEPETGDEARPSGGQAAYAGAALGAAGVPLLLLGALRMLTPAPGAGGAVAVLLAVTIAAIVLGSIATSRRQPGGRLAVVLAVLGLAGVVLLAVLTG